jgi:hypothetical protein
VAPARLRCDNTGSRCRGRRFLKLFPCTAAERRRCMTACRQHPFCSRSRTTGTTVPIGRRRPLHLIAWQRSTAWSGLASASVPPQFDLDCRHPILRDHLCQRHMPAPPTLALSFSMSALLPGRNRTSLTGGPRGRSHGIAPRVNTPAVLTAASPARQHADKAPRKRKPRSQTGGDGTEVTRATRGRGDARAHLTTVEGRARSE